MNRASIAVGLLGSLTITLAACGGGGGDEPAVGGSGAVCPPGNTTLRYTGGGNGASEPADFGSTFFATYCTGCHGAVPSGGAPSHANFATLAGIRDHISLIDARAAAGPTRVNAAMPPVGGAIPSVAERTLLGTWLACGAPDSAP
jgi:hypothetical protein